jgi:hypothetical protein
MAALPGKRDVNMERKRGEKNSLLKVEQTWDTAE